MSTSEARVKANQQNALKSTGPKTPEGKEHSRANAYKHGLTGSGTVLPEREAIEVERRVAAFEAELRPSGEVGFALVRRAATLSVRMERCVEVENFILIDRVRQAEADFVAPEGVDPAQAAKLRTEAGKRAMFDPSKEATLARRYEASAERGFFRALKELRQMQSASKAAKEEAIDNAIQETMASFSQFNAQADAFEAEFFDADLRTPSNLYKRPASAGFSTPNGSVDVPITIGRGR
jgi:hypothetical protein